MVSFPVVEAVILPVKSGFPFESTDSFKSKQRRHHIYFFCRNSGKNYVYKTQSDQALLLKSCITHNQWRRMSNRIDMAAMPNSRATTMLQYKKLWESCCELTAVKKQKVV
jgi:hypothetical protein